jgi:hypothetical protein
MQRLRLGRPCPGRLHRRLEIAEDHIRLEEILDLGLPLAMEVEGAVDQDLAGNGDGEHGLVHFAMGFSAAIATLPTIGRRMADARIPSQKTVLRGHLACASPALRRIAIWIDVVLREVR